MLSVKYSICNLIIYLRNLYIFDLNDDAVSPIQNF